METLLKIFFVFFILTLLTLAFQFTAENPLGGEPGIKIEIQGRVFEFGTEKD